MILVHPPVAKACEPPAGLAVLSGALNHYGVKHFVLDANLEGQLFLMNSYRGKQAVRSDTWTSRAFRNLERNIAALRETQTYKSVDKYSRAVMDINRAVEKSVSVDDVTVSLANYQHAVLSPLRSGDLLYAAENPELNPFYPYFDKRLRALVEDMQPAIIGVSISFLSQALCAFAMLGLLRRAYPALRLICGGSLITSWLKGPGREGRLQRLFAGLVDHFVEGPGERELLRLAGVVADGDLVCSPNYEFTLPGAYLSPGGVLPYSASTGCFWNRCAFCPEKAEGNSYLPAGTVKARQDISSLVRQTRPALLHLLDNSISPSFMRSLIDDPPGVPWYGFARIGRELADMDYCMALKKSGCVMLKLGVESGDQSVLDAMRKGIDLQTVSAALKALHASGISAYVYLLFGTPQETIDSARSTLEFTERHSHEISFLNVALFNMPASSPDAKSLKTGAFYEGDLSLYVGFEHPLGWNRKDVRQFIEGEFKRNSAVAAILKREPPFFTSNHAPFFVMRRD